VTGTHASTAWTGDVRCSLTTNVPVTQEMVSRVTGTLCGRGLRLEVPANDVRRVPVTLPRDNAYPFATKRDRHARANCVDK